MWEMLTWKQPYEDMMSAQVRVLACVGIFVHIVCSVCVCLCECVHVC
jgi:hypothetical protein